MAELKIIKEFKTQEKLKVPQEILALYPNGVPRWLNPKSPFFSSKIAADGRFELVKITDKDLKEKFAASIDKITGHYVAFDSVLAMEHKETNKAYREFINKRVDSKLASVKKQNRDNVLSVDGRLGHSTELKSEKGSIADI